VPASKIILFELNEVPWRIVEDFTAERPDSHLAQLLARSRSYETYAEDTALSPWITWPTLHRGVSDEHHTISDFGQDLAEIDAAYPSIWSLLSRAGVATGVCGSLHSYPLPGDVERYSFFVPDVFASGGESHPKAVEAFQEFNLAMSRESARNVSTKIPYAKALRFARAAPALGLRARTVLDIAAQLADERRRAWVKARRRTYQVVLAFDIFMRQLDEARPAFSTFFTNHVASTMHRYWAAKYPGDYAQSTFSRDWTDTYSGEIAWTMSKFDAMLGRLVRFVDANPPYELWLASSMGQAATEATTAKTQVYLEDVPRFMRALGLDDADWERRPAMLPRVVLSVKAKADQFATKLAKLEVSDRGPIAWKRLAHDVFRIHPGVLQDVVDERIRYDGQPATFDTFGFKNTIIEDAVGQSAYHVPQGMLIVRAPARGDGGRARTKISTIDVAPTLLDRFGVARPDYMRGSVFRP
jgi:hypothetical protein